MSSSSSCSNDGSSGTNFQFLHHQHRPVLLAPSPFVIPVSSATTNDGTIADDDGHANFASTDANRILVVCSSKTAPASIVDQEQTTSALISNCQIEEEYGYSSATKQIDAGASLIVNASGGGGVCYGCGGMVLDRFLLSVNAKTWHMDCLRCCQCCMPLDQCPSCFVKEERMFCKPCYTRQYGVKCAGCRRIIQSSDWVRRARQFVYHLACFSCDTCKRQLSTGEEFALQDCRLLCKQHYMELLEGDGQQKQKSKRVRTTFTEEQLQVLQAQFQIESNPDGQDLERIAQITGLSKRVTQVWFQNSRARQKKYQGGGAGGVSSGGIGSKSVIGFNDERSSNRTGSVSPTGRSSSAGENSGDDNRHYLLSRDADDRESAELRFTLSPPPPSSHAVLSAHMACAIQDQLYCAAVSTSDEVNRLC